MRNKTFNAGPLYLTASAANLINPATATGGVNAGSSAQIIELQGISIVNTDTVAHTFTLYKGATGGSAGGTEIIGKNISVAAGTTFEWRGRIILTSSDFLTGLADVASKLTFFAFGEVGVTG